MDTTMRGIPIIGNPGIPISGNPVCLKSVTRLTPRGVYGSIGFKYWTEVRVCKYRSAKDADWLATRFVWP